MALIDIGQRSALADASRLPAKALTLLFCTLPVANSLSNVRQSTGSGYTSLISIMLPLFAAALCIGIVISLGQFTSMAKHVETDRVGPLLFGLLLGWLLVSHLRMGELNAARNLVLILGTYFVLYCGAANGLDVSYLFRLTTRISSLLSVVLYVMNPIWFVNAHKYFFDSGKIVSRIPNVQGILSHPNLTALYFGAAVLLEISMWGRRSPRYLSGSFALLAFVLLICTQGRNAIGATVLALLCTAAYKAGRTLWPTIVLSFVFVAAWGPFILMIPAYLSAGEPDYAWFASVTNRGSLWDAISLVLPDNMLWGSGSSGILQALPYAMDPDVSEVTHAHNQVLNLILEGGLPALFIYAAMIVSVIFAIRKRQAPPEAVGLIVLLVVTTITETPFTPYVTSIGVVLLLLTMVLVFSDRSGHDKADAK